ncbi:hypothetical protein PV318_03140 [Streptomyces sp. ME02-6991-2B]|nr:hypothetical protein [Streptomyces sp. ME02-6991-2B]
MTDIATRPTAPDPAYLAAVLRRRQAMQAQLDAAKALFAEVDTEAAHLLTQQYEATRSTKADVALDDGTRFATVTRVAGEAEAQVTDRAAFHAWVRDTYPAHFGFRIIPARTEVYVDEAWADALLAQATAAGTAQYADPDTGEVHTVPGVAVRGTRRAYFRWLFTRRSKAQPMDGRELALDAIEAARIDLRAPLAIDTPDAVEEAAQ